MGGKMLNDKGIGELRDKMNCALVVIGCAFW